jgi:hypothetical protein
LRPQYTSADDPPQQKLAERSKDALERAMELAGEDLFYRGVDAQVNIAWLYYFTRRLDEAEKEAWTVIERIPRDYHIVRREGLPDSDLPHEFFWVQLGKAHLLLGEVAGSRFLDQEQFEALQEMGKHYTLSLAYDELFAPDFRDLRRGLQRAYVRLRKLNSAEFHKVHQGIIDAVGDYNLREPTFLDEFLAKRHLPQRPGVM